MLAEIVNGSSHVYGCVSWQTYFFRIPVEHLEKSTLANAPDAIHRVRYNLNKN